MDGEKNLNSMGANVHIEELSFIEGVEYIKEQTQVNALLCYVMKDNFNKILIQL